MNIEQRYNTAYPIRVEWSKNYTFLAPIKNFAYELLYYSYSEPYFQRIYKDLVKHNIFSFDLEKELNNLDKEKRELAKIIFDGLYNPFYKQILKLKNPQ